MRFQFPKKILSSACLDSLFPKICQHCGEHFKDGLSNILCQSCFDSIQPYQDPVCFHCGITLAPRAFEDSAILRCRDCGEDDYYLDQVRSLGAYEGPLRIAHHAFKFEGMEGLHREIVGKTMAHVPAVFWEGVEALVPVPLSPERKRERGYNPSELLAREISNMTGITLKHLVNKVRSTKPQMSLSRKERIQNPKGAYQVKNGEIIPTRIVLVDDVYTTGATLEECAKILKKAGAQWVGALAFGRTPHH
jgi:competence protein ComFC